MVLMQPERYCKKFSAVDNRRWASEANQREPSLWDWNTLGYEIAAMTFATTAEERGASKAPDFGES